MHVERSRLDVDFFFCSVFSSPQAYLDTRELLPRNHICPHHPPESSSQLIENASYTKYGSLIAAALRKTVLIN